MISYSECTHNENRRHTHGVGSVRRCPKWIADTLSSGVLDATASPSVDGVGHRTGRSASTFPKLVQVETYGLGMGMPSLGGASLICSAMSCGVHGLLRYSVYCSLTFPRAAMRRLLSSSLPVAGPELDPEMSFH